MRPRIGVTRGRRLALITVVFVAAGSFARSVTVRPGGGLVYSGPGDRFAVVASVDGGMNFSVIRASNGWNKIALTGGLDGWISPEVSFASAKDRVAVRDVYSNFRASFLSNAAAAAGSRAISVAYYATYIGGHMKDEIAGKPPSQGSYVRAVSAKSVVAIQEFDGPRPFRETLLRGGDTPVARAGFDSRGGLLSFAIFIPDEKNHPGERQYYDADDSTYYAFVLDGKGRTGAIESRNTDDTVNWKKTLSYGDNGAVDKEELHDPDGRVFAITKFEYRGRDLVRRFETDGRGVISCFYRYAYDADTGVQDRIEKYDGSGYLLWSRMSPRF